MTKSLFQPTTQQPQSGQGQTQIQHTQNTTSVAHSWEAEAQLQAHIQQALLSVQDLEQQRLNHLKK